MLLLEQDLNKYGKQMLNVRHRKKDIKEKEYENLTKHKKAQVSIYNLESEKTIMIYHTVNGKTNC